MKFVCDKCRTKYTIADEKVRGKVLKIRCKNCGNIIEVREPSTRPSTAARATKKPATQGALRAASRHGGTRKRSSAVAKVGPGGVTTRGSGKSSPGLGARADRSTRAPAKRAPASRSPAAQPRVGRGRPAKPGLANRPSAAAPKKAPASSFDEDPKTVVAALPAELLREFRSGGSASQPAAPADDEGGWYLGDDRGEYGPMTFAELAARCQRGEPGPNAEAWREGFGDWAALDEISALKPYLKVAPPPRPVTSAHPAPASPYTKSPGKDAAERAPAAPPKAPLPAKVTAAAPVDDSLVKIPAAVPASEPAPPEIRWPELPPIQPAKDTPPPMTAAAALAPEPFLPAAAVATPVASPVTGAHVSPGASQAAMSSQLIDLKRDRRPTLLIGAGVLVLSACMVVLVVYLISSGKKPSKDSSGATADSGMAMQPPSMRASSAVPLPRNMAAMPAPMDVNDSAELDLDIDVTTGQVSKGKQRRRKRNGMKSGETMATMAAASSGSLYGLPTMRPGFVGLMGFGSPTMRSTSGGASGGRPGDLRGVIKRNYNRLRRCYEKAARLNSRIKNPRLRITVKVRSSGKCRSVYVSPARHQSNGLGICIRRTIMSWRWPKFGADYRWTFSARFSSS